MNVLHEEITPRVPDDIVRHLGHRERALLFSCQPRVIALAARDGVGERVSCHRTSDSTESLVGVVGMFVDSVAVSARHDRDVERDRE